MSGNTAVQRLGEDVARLGGRHPVGCVKCSRAYLVPQGAIGALCPVCAGAPLKPQNIVMRDSEPERIVPAALPKAALANKLADFANVWFRCSDLTAENLASRATLIWWPVWLVDASCRGSFKAEVGFDYQVKSTEEVLEDGAWKTREVMRGKVRWEPRQGSVERRYDNVPAPALHEHDARRHALGNYDYRNGVDYGPNALGDGWVQLPDVSPDEAWPDAEAGIAKRVGRDVREAIDVKHVRGVTVNGDYPDRNYTWLLLPMYATWYDDSSGLRQPVLVHALTGEATGARLASMQKALLIAAILATIGISIIVLSLLMGLVGIVLLPLLFLAPFLAFCGVPFLLFAIWPPLSVWRNNARQGDSGMMAAARKLARAAETDDR